MMTLIIADDEIMECKVLEKIITENCPDVDVLPPALNGIDLVARVNQDRPDIAIVDINMPGLSGLDAVDIIRKQHPDVKILIVSAYSKFEYAQKAISLGASDYLLKPVKESLLTAAIDKLSNEISRSRHSQRERTGMNQIVRSYRGALENEFISEIILGDLREESAAKYASLLPQPLCGAFLLHIQPAQPDADCADVFERILADMKAISACLGRIRKNALALCVFPPAPNPPAHQRQWIAETFDCVWRRYGAYALQVGVSAFKYDLEGLCSAYQETLNLLRSAPGEGVFFSSEQDHPLQQLRLDADKHRCQQLARQGQYGELAVQLVHVVQSARETQADFESFQLYLLNLLHDLLAALPQVQPILPLSLFLRWTYWRILLECRTFDALAESIKQIFEQLAMRSPSKRHSRHIINSLLYIAEHYTENLSLESVAEQNGISGFYLSRLFKQELHHTFLEILTDIRISNALDLLYTTTLSAQEISERCGYLNTTYFYKLFKKQTGMTIGDMRSRIGQYQ